MLNGLFVFVVLASVLLAAWQGRMDALSAAVVTDGGRAVTLALGLVGVMAFFLGLMRVAEQGGALRGIARLIAPIMRRLFPSVPADHPAMGAMIMNIASNMLGLANAATPFGVKAMEELDRLNGNKGQATNAMVMFLAINTSGLALLPTGVIGLRASLGSADASGIFLTTWFASACATLVGVSAALLLQRLPRYRWIEARPEEPAEASDPVGEAERQEASVPAVVASTVAPADRRLPLRLAVAGLFAVVLIVPLVRHLVLTARELPVAEVIRGMASQWTLPLLVSVILLYGWCRGVRVYDALVEGAKEGFQVALRIIPFLVAILVAIGMFRAAGGIELLTSHLRDWTEMIGMPAEALPMALLRPLSGSGAYGVMAEIMQTHGPDSLIGYLVSTYQGSTETTFYVLAVYCGAVGVTRTRHALPACLLADVTGILAATWVVNALFG